MPEPEVGVPGSIVEAEATDLATPTDDLLVRLELLPKEGEQDVGPFSGTPYSLQVITAGALEINKVAVAIIASLGGVSVIAAWFEAFWEEEGDPVRITLLVGLAILLSAFALAIAMIVRSDVAQGEASAAQYHTHAPRSPRPTFGSSKRAARQRPRLQAIARIARHPPLTRRPTLTLR
jgi:hypothetical protein